jgi:hypothetical protein
MLEDENTGPLYKTIYAYKSTRTFSVSKINEIISRFFTMIWFILAIKYVVDNIRLEGDIAYVEILITIVLIYFTLAMFKGYGRGNFGST